MIHDLIDRIRYASPAFWRGVCVLGVAVAVLYSLAARARDPDGRYAGSLYAEWFRTQHNEKGEWCCDKSDGHYYDGAYTLNQDGSVTIGDGKDATTLPSYMVLKHPNPTGRAVWWYIDLYGGRSSYCFAPGTLS
jgi:hypothetical protein